MNSREVFSKELHEFGNNTNLSANECETFGITWGCKEDCPVFERGKCEMQEENEVIFKNSAQIKTLIYAVWCGAGKTYICEKTNINACEIEYWKYKDYGLKKEYLQDIKNQMGKVDYIFISTDPEGLKLLKTEGYNITLIYPENALRNEYLDRYIERDSSYDFIGTFMKHWNIWLDELKEQDYCKHIILKKGEYLNMYI
jgi:hypothetical protein